MLVQVASLGADDSVSIDLYLPAEDTGLGLIRKAVAKFRYLYHRHVVLSLALLGCALFIPACILCLHWQEWPRMRTALREYTEIVGLTVVPALLCAGAVVLLRMAQ